MTQDPNITPCEALADYATTNSIEASFLDGAVHELASSIASDTNNAGVEAQISYLVEHTGFGPVEKLVKALVKERTEILDFDPDANVEATAKAFAVREQRTRKTFNRSLELMNEGKISRAEHHETAKKTDAANIALFTAVKTHPELKHCALTHTILAQSNRNHSSAPGGFGNHELGNALAKAFPQGSDDSECDQCYFYIHGDFVQDVVQWLTEGDYTESYSVDDTTFPTFKWPGELDLL